MLLIRHMLLAHATRALAGNIWMSRAASLPGLSIFHIKFLSHFHLCWEWFNCVSNFDWTLSKNGIPPAYFLDILHIQFYFDYPFSPPRTIAMAHHVLLYSPLLLVYTLLLLLLLPPTTFCAPADPSTAPVPGEEALCKSLMDVVNGTARLTLCMQGRKVWKERRNNDRTTQVFATILNTGDSKVCDLHVEVSNMENAIRWWPTWFNTTVYPYFALSPGQTVSVGAVIPQAKGFPQIKIIQMRSCDGESPLSDEEDDIDMTDEVGGDLVSNNIDLERNATTATTTTTSTVLTTPTDPAAPVIPAKRILVEVNKANQEPAVAVAAPLTSAALATAADSTAVAPAPVPAPKAEAPGDEAIEEEEEKEDEEIPSALKGKKKCEVLKGVGGVQARWCVDMSPKVWVEPKRKKRYVRVAGEVTNVMSNISLCNIEFWLQSNKSAVSTWPEWWPNSGDEQLDPGNSFMVGANVHFKRGKPQIKLLSFDECVDTGALPEDPFTAAPAGVGADTGVNGGGGAGFGGDVGGGPAPSPWQSPTQDQGQGQWQGQQQGGGQQWAAPTPVPKPTTIDLMEAINNNSNDNNHEDNNIVNNDDDNNNNNNNNNNNGWNNGSGGGSEGGDGGGGGDGGNL